MKPRVPFAAYKRVRANMTRTAEEAFYSVLHTQHFIKRMEAWVRESRRRSRAARKAVRTRKARRESHQ